MNYVISVIAGFLSGILGSMGLGGGSVLIIYLVLFTNTEQLEAQGINLIFFGFCALLSVIVYSIKKQVKFKVIYPVIIGGIAGSLIANSVFKSINPDIIGKIFGCFLIVVGILQLIKARDISKSEKADTNR